MKLRTRITWTTIIVSIPLALALLGIDAHSRQRAAEDELYDLVANRLDAPERRAACESGHRRPSPPPPGPPPGLAHVHREPARVWGYSAAGVPVDEDAPHLDIPAEADDEQPYVSRSSLLGGTVEILLRTPWGEGPCAYVLATGTKEPWLGALLPDSPVWLLPLLLVFVAIIASVGPVVRRLAALEAAVRTRGENGTALDPRLLADRGEVGALARAFDAAANALRTEAEARRRQEEALRAFLADTTHDVMIPLTVLQGHLTELRGDDDAPSEALLGAMRETHYIASLLHNLGAIAKLDQPRPHIERTDVDLGRLLERVVARHRPLAAQLDIELEVSVPEPPIVLPADLTLLEQAVSNLVYNAVRHNRPGGHVAVFAEPTGDRFSIHIVDDGPGIDPDERDRLLERGRRGNPARTRAPGGLGLGLDIVRRVCDLHDYTLALDTSAHGGLHVRIDGLRT